MTEARKFVLYVTPPQAQPKGLLARVGSMLMDPVIEGPDGFFRAALHRAFDVTEITLDEAKKEGKVYLKEFDAIVVNWNCRPDGEPAKVEDLDFLKGIGRPRVLLVAGSETEKLPVNPFLDLFALVFKAAPFSDRVRYKITSFNRSKIHATMPACPLVAVRATSVEKTDLSKVGYDAPELGATQDVYFSGSRHSRERLDVETDFANSGFTGLVNLLPKEGERKPDSDYIRYIRAARVNLALRGGGAFTARHLELWCLCAFMLSTPALREIELPMPAQEGVHYVSFESRSDLMDKIRHYIDHEDERLRIATEGRRLFEKYYSFEKHGSYLKKTIAAL